MFLTVAIVLWATGLLLSLVAARDQVGWMSLVIGGLVLYGRFFADLAYVDLPILATLALVTLARARRSLA